MGGGANGKRDLKGRERVSYTERKSKREQEERKEREREREHRRTGADDGEWRSMDGKTKGVKGTPL